MATSMDSAFEKFLIQKLQELNKDVDLDVFPSYVTSILEDDLPEEEKEEMIGELLQQLTEEEAQLKMTCSAIISQWKCTETTEESKVGLSVDDRLCQLLENQNLDVVKNRQLTAEEQSRKAAILAQYEHVVEDVEDTENQDEDEDGDNEDSLERISNAAQVANREREQRQKEKEMYEQKKAKDKEDREKQKQKAQDRKEAEKKRTQKGERRR